MLLRQLNYWVVILFVFFFAVVGVCGIGSRWILLVWPISVADDVKADLSFLLPDKHVAKLKYWHVKLNWKLELKAIFLFVFRSNCFRLLTMQSFRAVESFSFLTTILQISLSKTNLTVRLIFAQFVHFYGSLFCFYSFVINLLFLSGFPLFFLLFLVSWFPILI